MALLEGGRPPRDILPPINRPDFDIPRSEKSEYGRGSIMPALSISTGALASPTSMYSGPPPPYSCAPSTTETVYNSSGYFSPPHSITRRSTRDEKDLSTLKTLPSLHEALGGDKPIQFSGPPSATQSNAPGSTPTTAIGQTFPDAPRGPPNPFSHISAPPPITLGQPPADTLAPKPATVNSTGIDPPSHLPPYLSSPPTHTNTHRSSAGSFSSVTRPFDPINSNPPYPSESAAQTLPPREFPPQSAVSQSHSSSVFTFESAGKFDDTRNPFLRTNPPISYGETVKRHLDVFDAELALNEVAEMSNRTCEFSRSWSQRCHQGNRSDLFAESAPHMQDIDEMIRQQHRVLENLNRIREVVILQQDALSEQRARAARGHMEDEYHGLHEDFKSGGFAGGDAKKRRGKAAPPGRCHSCNRAETPEWRRGPDGARTLCNACGLHYAKLTRKLGANKASALTGSNLRPKGLDTRPLHV